MIYLALALFCPVCQVSSATSPPCSEHYQIMPHSSICPCLDSIPLLFFSKSHLPTLSLTSRRHVSFLFSLLMLLAGDVSLNPGPPAASGLNIACLNIRSASSITISTDKPPLIQEFISDNNLDLLFLTETWLSPDTPPSVLKPYLPPIIHVLVSLDLQVVVVALQSSLITKFLLLLFLLSSLTRLSMRCSN